MSDDRLDERVDAALNRLEKRKADEEQQDKANAERWHMLRARAAEPEPKETK